MYFPVDFPHEVIAYTCMYLVDFPQHKHTHTHNKKYQQIRDNWQWARETDRARKQREREGESERRVQATYRYTLKASRTTTTTINNRRTKIWICFCFNFEKFRKIVFRLLCDIFNFHSFLSKRLKLNARRSSCARSTVHSTQFSTNLFGIQRL